MSKFKWSSLLFLTIYAFEFHGEPKATFFYLSRICVWFSSNVNISKEYNFVSNWSIFYFAENISSSHDLSLPNTSASKFLENCSDSVWIRCQLILIKFSPVAIPPLVRNFRWIYQSMVPDFFVAHHLQCRIRWAGPLGVGPWAHLHLLLLCVSNFHYTFVSVLFSSAPAHFQFFKLLHDTHCKPPHLLH